MHGRKLSLSTTLWLLTAFSLPAAAIDLSQLCGSGDCVVSTNTTVDSASGPLIVTGNFTVNSGVVLEFLVNTQIKIDGNLTFDGIVGGPGNGGAGGLGGSSGQPGVAGGNAPSVVSSLFDVKGNITIGSGGVTAEGGSGGVGGDGATGELGGNGGTGGTAGSLTFNTCQSFVSNSGVQLRVSGGNGGNGGAGQTNGTGGAGGNAGAVTINAKQTITSNASVTAVGGNGGLTGGSAGSDGAVTLIAGGTISVGAGTLDLGLNSPTVIPNQSSIPSLAFCTAPPPSVPAITGITAGSGTLTVAFSASTGEVTDYTASCTSIDGGSPGSATGPNSPITVSGLTNGKTYTCTVVANGPGGSSAASTPSSPATPNPPPPVTPTITGVTAGNDALIVAFSASTGTVDDYTASCTSSNGGTPGSVTGPTSPITVSGLTNGKTYTCTVVANGPGGSSAASTPSSPTTPNPPPPDTPTITGVTPGNASLTVAFSTSSGMVSSQTVNSASAYEVTAYTANCSSSNGGTPGSATGPNSPITVPGLTNGKSYTCTVTANGPGGSSSASAPSSTAIPNPSAPDAPIITGVTPGNASLTVAFSASMGEVTDYTASCTSSDGGTPGSATGPNSPITVSGLTNGKSYTCTVTANGPGGSSSASTPSSPATPTPPLPNPIPTLAMWGSTLLTLMLLLGGLWYGRRGRIG